MLVSNGYTEKNLTGRQGAPRGRPVPIVCKFSLFKQRESVRKAGHLLKGTSFGIHEQFSDEIAQRRNMIYPPPPHLRQAKRSRQRAVLVKDKVFVGGSQIRVAEHGDVGNRAGRPVPPPSPPRAAANRQPQGHGDRADSTHL